MEPWLSRDFGNASSRDHRWGWNAAEAVEQARLYVSAAMNSRLTNVVFGSGATEALNAMIRSYIGFGGWASKTIIAASSEHEAVLAPVRYLCRETGVALRILDVDREGRVDLAGLRSTLTRTSTALVVLMAANNEIGTIHPVREIGGITHAAGAQFLCDTTQAFGKVAVDLSKDDIDFATISAHKINGPKGVGALLHRGSAEKTTRIDGLILGGAQERGLRGGTLNIPGIVGLGEACRLVQEQLGGDVTRMGVLRDRLEEGILSQVPQTWINGDPSNRLCNTSNMGFKGVDARTMIRDMHDIAVSTRSACSSGNSGPSHVLKAIGLSDEDAYSCIRFSLGRFTTEEEIDYAINKVVTSVHKLRRNKSVRM